MMVGLAIGGTIIAMLNQQIAFLKIFQAQSFLNEEAPIISAHVSKLLVNAERFRLHDSVADASYLVNGQRGQNFRSDPSPVLALDYRLPNGDMRSGILSFEDRGQGDALYYYVERSPGVYNVPQWTITNKAAEVLFFTEFGILRARMTGPAGEEIILSGAMQ